MKHYVVNTTACADRMSDARSIFDATKPDFTGSLY